MAAPDERTVPRQGPRQGPRRAGLGPDGADAHAPRPRASHAAASGGSLHVAVVHSADAVRFVAVARSPETLAARLAEYVRREADDALWPADARRVHRPLSAGRPEGAVAAYFAAVGARWDEERLAVARVDVTA
jgi:hypothetical protein